LRLEMRRFHRSTLAFHFIRDVYEAINFPAGLAGEVASGNPSSSSSQPLSCTLRVPDPMPKKWLVKYSILTYFVPPVASFFGSKTMMDP
jgi:hypothetical protein